MTNDTKATDGLGQSLVTDFGTGEEATMLTLTINGETDFADADGPWGQATLALLAERDALRSVLAKAKAYHDRDHGCNGFTAEYEILHAEMDIALNGQPNKPTTSEETARHPD